jgi:phosphoglycolate phosphatase-like HAD superfamily hydrolase
MNSLPFEILNRDLVRGRIRHAVFDFDGTLSLVREGWQAVMAPMFVDELARHAPHQDRSELAATVEEFVARLTGKQTIYQAIELADRIRALGGAPPDPLAIKHEYLRRLEVRIADRVAGLADGAVDPETLLVPGARAFLEGLRARGVTLYLASGTDEPFVKREAALLDIDRYFDGGVYGAKDDYKSFSKKMLIDRLFAENGLRGPELLGVGDGYVEIENTRGVGGIALGVPCREDRPTELDEWKRPRLVAAGADLITINFERHGELLAYLFAE